MNVRVKERLLHNMNIKWNKIESTSQKSVNLTTKKSTVRNNHSFQSNKKLCSKKLNSNFYHNSFYIMSFISLKTVLLNLFRTVKRVHKRVEKKIKLETCSVQSIRLKRFTYSFLPIMDHVILDMGILI